MNAPLQPAHSPFGGSGAPRLLHCTMSPSLIDKVPAHLRKTSSYATRGTALHAAMPRLIERECSLADLVGETIDGYTITTDDVENALRPVLRYVESLLDQPGAQYYLEQRVVFPGIDTFGTADLLVRINDTVYVIDFKFGAGVRVLALYPEGDEDVLNAQLCFYAAAARHSLPAFFAGTGADDIVLVILQPQSIEPEAETISVATVTHAELDEFVAVYRAACEEALSPSPRLARGAWCRFCPARPICPLHTAALLDLAQFEVPAPLPYGGAFATPASKEAYLQLLADGLNLVDAIKDLGAALHDQAKFALDRGDAVPGYALTAGRAVRQWRDEKAAIGALMDLGLFRDDVIEESMRSPKQVEVRAKARGIKVPSEFIVSTRSGVSLVRAENVRIPTPGRDENARLFSEALKALLEGGQT